MSQRSFLVGTLNCSTLKKNQISEISLGDDYDFLTLTNATLSSTKEQTFPDGSKLFYFCHDSAPCTGILVHKRWAEKATADQFYYIDHGLAFLDVFVSEELTLRIVACAAPQHCKKQEQDQTRFRWFLQRMVNIVERTRLIDRDREVIVAGNFQAQVGSRGNTSVIYNDNGKENYVLVGPYGLGQLDSRGSLLINFCRNNQLAIQNTIFESETTERWTSAVAGETLLRTAKQTDFIISSCLNKRLVCADARVSQLLPSKSLHRGVRAHYYLSEEQILDEIDKDPLEVIRGHYQRCLQLPLKIDTSTNMCLKKIYAAVSQTLETWYSVQPTLPLEYSEDMTTILVHFSQETSRLQLAKIFITIISSSCLPDDLFTHTLSLLNDFSKTETLLRQVCQSVSELFIRTIRSLLVTETRRTLKESSDCLTSHLLTVDEIFRKWRGAQAMSLMIVNCHSHTEIEDYELLFKRLKQYLPEGICEIASSLFKTYSGQLTLHHSMFNLLLGSLECDNEFSEYPDHGISLYFRHGAMFFHKDVKQIQKKLERFNSLLKALGIRLNSTNIHFMSPKRSTLALESEVIVPRKTLVHFRVELRYDVKRISRKPLQINVHSANKQFINNIDVLKNSSLSVADKMDAHESFTAYFLRGCETWSESEIWACYKTLVAGHHAILQIMLDIEKANYNFLIEMANVEHIVTAIFRRKYILAQETLKLPAESPIKKILARSPEGKIELQNSFRNSCYVQVLPEDVDCADDERQLKFIERGVRSLLCIALSNSLFQIRKQKTTIEKTMQKLSTQVEASSTISSEVDKISHQINAQHLRCKNIEERIIAMSVNQNPTESNSAEPCLESLLASLNLVEDCRAQAKSLKISKYQKKHIDSK